MRLIIVYDQIRKDTLINILVRNNLAERENIIHFPTFEKAIEFFTNDLIDSSGHIDGLIVGYRYSKNDYDKHLADWLRISPFEYSSGNFKQCSIPIILFDKDIHSSDLFYRNQYNTPFDSIVEWGNSNVQGDITEAIQSCIRGFRNSILDDLDMLELKKEEIESPFYYNRSLRYLFRFAKDSRYWASRTKVLSNTFIENPRYLNYDWFSSPLERFSSAIDEYHSLIGKDKKFNRKNSEKKIFHNFFKENQWALTRDVFKSSLHEPELKINRRHFEEPDYLLTSELPNFIPTNVFEVKLPTLQILHSRKRKPLFKSEFNDAAGQVGYYKRYFRSPKNRNAIEEALKYKTNLFSFTLLGSNDDELNKNAELVKELMGDMYKNITHYTHQKYAELLERFFERLESLK